MDKISNKFLLMVLGILAGIVIFTQYQGDEKERTFRKDLGSFEQADVDQILVQSPGKDQMEFSKDGEEWQVKTPKGMEKAVGSRVEQMVQQFDGIKVQKVAALNDSKWVELKVNQELGTRVQLMASGKKVFDAYVGKLAFKQAPGAGANPMQQQGQQPQISSYIRLADEKEVYSVEGMLSGALSQDVATFVDSSLFAPAALPIDSLNIPE